MGALHRIKRHYTLHDVILHYITLHYITLHYTTLHTVCYIRPHYLTVQSRGLPDIREHEGALLRGITACGTCQGAATYYSRAEREQVLKLALPGIIVLSSADVNTQ